MPNFNFGNASTPQPLPVAGKIGSNNATVIDSNVPPPIPASPGTKVVSDTFNTATILASPEAFDVQTGISSDSPEIISLTDFLPVYNDVGTFTSFGELLQAKQDSLLISARSSMNSLFGLPEIKKILEKIKENRSSLKDFSTSYGSEIINLLFEFETIKKKLDIRYPLDAETLKLLGFSSQSTFLFGYPSSIDDLLREKKSIISNWTSTKSWLQCCLKLKEILRESCPTTLTSYPTNKLSQSPFSNQYKDPYSIVTLSQAPSSQFSFSSEAKNNVPNIFGIQDQLDATSFLFTDVEKTLDDIARCFSNLSENSIFTQSYYSDNTEIEDLIAKMSYLITKEFVFSTKMSNSFSSILTQFGYAISNQGNLDVWDYLIGQTGKDITDVNPAPLGGGSSLVSLSQFVDTNNNEILTFEDKYISDNIGTRNSGVVMTPGTFYYLESSLNAQANGFDTTRISSLVSKLKTSLDLTNRISSDLLFKSTPAPYGSLKERIKAVSNKNSNVSVSDTSDHFLMNPIALIRKIEQEVISGGNLVKRDPGPTTWTKSANPSSWSFGAYSIPLDISPLLISAALEDHKLLSCIFFYVLLISNNVIENTGDANQDLFPFKPYQTIIDQIKSRLKEKFSNKVFVDKGTVNVPVNIIDNLSQINTFTLTLSLERIGKLIKSINSQLTSSGLLIQTPAGTNEEPVTVYSGVKRTAFIMSVFLLCCLMIHSSNPERISYYKETPDEDQIVVSQVYDPVIIVSPNEPGSSKISQNNFSKSDSKEIVADNKSFKALSFDRILNKTENLLYLYAKRTISNVNVFTSFISTLNSRFSNLKTKLESNNYQKFFNDTNQIIQDAIQTRRLMTQEQMALVSSHLHDISERASESYVSAVKQVYPYFDELKNNNNFESLLPIDDVSLVSWNLCTKELLNQGPFRESEGFNKKIVSVGIPQQLYRRLSVSASELSSSTLRNNLISVNLYRVDLLRPGLKHKPLKFLFDLRRFPTKNISNYSNAADILNGKSKINFEEFPFLEFVPQIGQTILVNSFKDSFRSLSIKKSEKQEIYRNHLFSFLMEEYINFVSDFSFSERIYNEYSNISTVKETEADKFMLTTLGSNPFDSLNPSVESFYAKNSFLFSNKNSFIKKLILPKKFDRVFHIVFDPDDFEINSDPLNGTPAELINEYKLSNIIFEKKESNSQTIKLKRTMTSKSETTFDKYFVAIESYTPQLAGY